LRRRWARTRCSSVETRHERGPDTGEADSGAPRSPSSCQLSCEVGNIAGSGGRLLVVPPACHPRLERREGRLLRRPLIRSDANALSTVDRPIPSCLATCRLGTPSATSRLINAQSSTEITHPICLGGLVFARRYGLVFNRRRQSSDLFRCDDRLNPPRRYGIGFNPCRQTVVRRARTSSIARWSVIG
jgi:hypothetical protein